MPYQSFAADSACTLENSQKLLGLAANFIGKLTAEDQKLGVVLRDQKISDAKEIRKQYIEIRKASKVGVAAEELLAFAKAHPECDKDGNFRIIHPIK